MPKQSLTQNAAGEASLYENAIDRSGYSGTVSANDADQSRNNALNDGRRNRAAQLTEEQETGSDLSMGTESDMENLLSGNSRDPGALRTLKDDENMEDRY